MNDTSEAGLGKLAENKPRDLGWSHTTHRTRWQWRGKMMDFVFIWMRSHVPNRINIVLKHYGTKSLPVVLKWNCCPGYCLASHIISKHDLPLIHFSLQVHSDGEVTDMINLVIMTRTLDGSRNIGHLLLYSEFNCRVHLSPAVEIPPVKRTVTGLIPSRDVNF